MEEALKARICEHVKSAIGDIWQPWDILDQELTDSNDKNYEAFQSVSASCAPESVLAKINQACDDIELDLTGRIEGWLRESVVDVVMGISEITSDLKSNCDEYCRFWESKRGFRGFLGTIAYLAENPIEVPKAWFGTSTIQKKVVALTDPIVGSTTLIGDQIVRLTIELERSISARTKKRFKFNPER